MLLGMELPLYKTVKAIETQSNEVKKWIKHKTMHLNLLMLC